ncbi:MAG: caspase family protein [Nodosilinea sp.]
MSRDALVVGINTYQHLPSLTAPANDAESVARCLESFGECRVLRLPEAIRDRKPAVSPQAPVTTQMLEEALIRLFKPSGKTVPQLAVFYYSGHGLQRNAGIQEGYLATSDANPNTGNYGLSLYWLRRLLQESPVRQRVILLDCCNSGELFNILEADPGAKTGTDRLFMAAAREYEAAYESLNGAHSVFTEALLSGLNPYKIKGGVVNGHSLTDDVNRKLKGELQQPLFESSGAEIVLTRVSGLPSAVPTSHTSTLDRLKQLRFGFCPFQGEAPFDTPHAGLFFGREAVTQTLTERVSQARFCALVGASAIGKTSLLRAGLIPALNQQTQAEHYPNWDIRYFTPGRSPLGRLAEAFVDPQITGIQRAEQTRRAESFLQNGGQGLAQLVHAIAKADPATQGQRKRIVLVIDQFEELFTADPTPTLDAERRLLIDCLVTAASLEHLPLHVVIGLRANHLEDIQSFPEFHTLVTNHRLTVPAMTYNQVKATIVGPLEKVGLRYDANLVYTLLLDVVGAPGELALLQLTLKELWQHRELDPAGEEAPKLTLTAYAEMGGIRQLLSQRASQLYDGLPEAEKPLAQRIFISLCEMAEGAAPTRRQVQLQELTTPSRSQGQVLATLEKLMAARLVMAQASANTPPLSPGMPSATVVPAWSASGDSAGSGSGSLTEFFRQEVADASGQGSNIPHFDIVHESLIRTWPLLQTWLHDSRPTLKAQRAVETAAQDWHRHQCPNHADYFLTKSRLIEAKALQAHDSVGLSVLATSYLQACDRYSRRCARNRLLMKLMVPLSMATGMLAAYGQSLVTESLHPWKLALASPPAATEEAPAFHLVEPKPDDVPGHPDHLAQSAQPPRPNAQQPLEPDRELTNPEQQMPRTISDLSDTEVQPGATPNSRLNKVAEFVSPTDPTQIIQVWCILERADQVCTTSSSPR